MSQDILVKNASFTRPANTTQYAAGEAVTDSTSAPTVITFSNVVSSNGGAGSIVKVLMVDSANAATKGSFELWLFDTTFTPDNDNAVFTPTDAELATLIDVIPLPSTFVGDATAGADGNAVYIGTLAEPIDFKCKPTSSNLFGALVVRNAYTPVSGESFTIRLFIEQI